MNLRRHTSNWAISVEAANGRESTHRPPDRVHRSSGDGIDAAGCSRWFDAPVARNGQSICDRMTQSMTNLPDLSMSSREDWLPDRWKATNPDPTPAARV
jgi:hypothetical protein